MTALIRASEVGAEKLLIRLSDTCTVWPGDI